MISKKSIFIICVLLNSITAKAQSIPFIDRMDTVFATNNGRNYYKPATATNEVVILLNVLYKGYKKFISSQDGQSCSFSPSCSEYAAISIQKHGVLKGLLMAFDRLQRCNGFKSSRYKYDLKNGLKLDPV